MKVPDFIRNLWNKEEDVTPEEVDEICAEVEESESKSTKEVK